MFRLSIADNKDWSSKFWTGEKWPYLTLPSLIQSGVDRVRPESRITRTPSTIDRIYKWTCPKEVEEEGNRDQNSLGSWVLGPEE